MFPLIEKSLTYVGKTGEEQCFQQEQQGIATNIVSFSSTLSLTKHTSQESLAIEVLQLEVAQLGKQGQVASKLL